MGVVTLALIYKDFRSYQSCSYKKKKLDKHTNKKINDFFLGLWENWSLRQSATMKSVDTGIYREI